MCNIYMKEIIKLYYETSGFNIFLSYLIFPNERILVFVKIITITLYEALN